MNNINFMHLTVMLLTRLQNHRHLKGSILGSAVWKVSGGSVMRTHDGYDSRDSYERA